MNTDLLTEFEENKKQEKSQDWFGILICFGLFILFGAWSYMYYNIYFIALNKERLYTCIVYAFASGFQLCGAVLKLIIRYNFIRK